MKKHNGTSETQVNSEASRSSVSEDPGTTPNETIHADTPPPFESRSIDPRRSRLAFSVRETAQLLGVSEKTVRRLVARGLLRCSRALRHLLIPKKDIERFLEETSTR